MYFKRSMRRTHEIKLRFSDIEELKISQLVQETGAQPAVLLRELIMEALASLNVDINEDPNSVEVAQKAL